MNNRDQHKAHKAHKMYQQLSFILANLNKGTNGQLIFNHLCSAVMLQQFILEFDRQLLEQYEEYVDKLQELDKLISS